MADGRHSESGDRSFAASLAKHVASGVALVLVVAAVFWGIGRTGDDPGSPVIEQPTTPLAASPDATTDGGPEELQTTEPADPAATAADEPSPDATPEPSPDATAGDISPGAVTVQVLDAAGDDGSAAEDAAERLRAAGYRVIATNQAVRTYESSTLFWTEGNEGKAKVIAADFSEFDVVEEQPGNLSDTVDVHAVIGTDWFAEGE